MSVRCKAVVLTDQMPRTCGELVMYNPTNTTPAAERQCAEYLAGGQMHIKSMITHVVPADRAPEMYDMLLTSPQEAMGVVLNWEEK